MTRRVRLLLGNVTVQAGHGFSDLAELHVYILPHPTNLLDLPWMIIVFANMSRPLRISDEQ